jgi:hypothetical protein
MLLPLAILLAAVIAPKSGGAMCALTPADFQAAGIPNAAKPQVNVQDGGASASCVYAGKSAATGGIELDVFNPAGPSLAAVKQTFETAIGESGAKRRAIRLPGVDEARWDPESVSGGPPFATLAARRGSLVFVLGIPAGKNAEAQLTKLAELVLGRF